MDVPCVGANELTRLGPHAGKARCHLYLGMIAAHLIIAAMLIVQLLGQAFHFSGTRGEFGARARTMLGCVRGQLDDIDREHVATDQALLAKDRQHLPEHRRDGIARASDNVGKRRKMRIRVTRDGVKKPVVARWKRKW